MPDRRSQESLQSLVLFLEPKYIFVAYKGLRQWKHGEHGPICRPATNAEQTTKKRDRTSKEQGKADEGDGAGGYSLIVYLSWNIPWKQRMACGVAHSFRPLPIQTLEGLVRLGYESKHPPKAGVWISAYW